MPLNHHCWIYIKEKTHSIFSKITESRKCKINNEQKEQHTFFNVATKLFIIISTKYTTHTAIYLFNMPTRCSGSHSQQMSKTHCNITGYNCNAYYIQHFSSSGVCSASDTNEYQGISLGVKCCQHLLLTTLPFSLCQMLQ